MRRATFGSAGHLLPGVADEYRVHIFSVSTVAHNEAARGTSIIFVGYSLGLRLVFALEDTLATSCLQLLETLQY
jgi:hypothetical protein